MSVPPISSKQAGMPDPSQDAQNQVNLIQNYLAQLNTMALEQAEGQDESGPMNTIYNELQGASAALALDGKSGTNLSADAKNLINLLTNLPTLNPSTAFGGFLMQLNQYAGYTSVLSETLKQPASTPATNPQLLDAQVQAATLTNVASTIQNLINLQPPASQTDFQDQIISLGLSCTNQLQLDESALTSRQNGLVSDITHFMNNMASYCQDEDFNPNNLKADSNNLARATSELQFLLSIKT